jgi:hypothetical protein
MKYLICILAALFLSAARPIAAPPALPPARIHGPGYRGLGVGYGLRSAVSNPRYPIPHTRVGDTRYPIPGGSPAVLQPTPAVTISGTVNGFTSGGSPAPIGIYTAYGATLQEALSNAQALEQDVRARATETAVRP